MTLALQIELSVGIATFIISAICCALLKVNYDDWEREYNPWGYISGLVKIIITAIGSCLFGIWLVFMAVAFIWHIY